jgi:hypothetical protein
MEFEELSMSHPIEAHHRGQRGEGIARMHEGNDPSCSVC